jgi:membrane-bound metal-dependent hydrolase YbcI (DUF457 family)
LNAAAGYFLRIIIMPFTPLHLGPGLLFKGIGGTRFSFLTFAMAQVALDIEPLLGLWRGAERLHGVTHTYLAALGIAAAVAVSAPLLCRPLLRRWHHELRFYRLNWLIEQETFTALAVSTGAVFGTMSHVLLDSLMHSDVTPFAPWSNANPLHGALSFAALQWLCLATGAVGAAGWLAQKWRQRTAIAD